VPAFVFAQGGPRAGFGGIGDFVEALLGFINSYLTPFVFALAFIFFLWGVFKFFFWQGLSGEGRDEGKQLILWAVIAFVVMVSIWGLVNVVATGLGFAGGRAPALPQIPGVGGQGGAPSGGGITPSAGGPPPGHQGTVPATLGQPTVY